MLKKYEFINKVEFQSITEGLEFTHKPIVLGHKVLTEGEYDDEGVEITAPTYNDKLMIDVYWEESEDSSVLDAYEIFPNNPMHKILGIDE